MIKIKSVSPQTLFVLKSVSLLNQSVYISVIGMLAR